MRKSYSKELSVLPETYCFASSAPIDALSRAVKAATAGSLAAIGSGGSLSAAHFAATLHQRVSRKLAKAMTPLESYNFPLSSTEASVLLLSASGGNPDILDAFQDIVVREPNRLAVLTARFRSKLSRLVERYRYVDYCALELPAGNDGFLATNSLFAFCVALTRAYTTICDAKDQLPVDFFHLIGDRNQIDIWRELCQSLWDNDNLTVLFPPMLQAAAVHLESNFTEAAIGNVQIADYRHFAHGRHHWLAKRGESTSVLAFVTPSVRFLAKRTLSLLPTSIHVAALEFSDDGAISSLAALASAIVITGFASEARGINPSRPGVPVFGRKIYHLRARPHRGRDANARRQTIILRKSINAPLKTDEHWETQLNNFVDRLSSARFRGVVFDYDGTLCDEGERFSGPCNEIANSLATLLKNEIALGIATGRGRSVRQDLRKIIEPNFWDRIVVGYYNGCETGLLSDDGKPTGQTPTRDTQSLFEQLSKHPFIADYATCEVRTGQISLIPAALVSLETLWQIVSSIVQDKEFTVLMSSHAIDVIPSNVSKLAVVNRLRQSLQLDKMDPLLCVGDRGRFPGNDVLLLSQPLALSVHEVSADPDVCWNLARPGHRGVQAVQDYFKVFSVRRGHFRIKAKLLLK